MTIQQSRQSKKPRCCAVCQGVEVSKVVLPLQVETKDNNNNKKKPRGRPPSGIRCTACMHACVNLCVIHCREALGSHQAKLGGGQKHSGG